MKTEWEKEQEARKVQDGATARKVWAQLAATFRALGWEVVPRKHDAPPLGDIGAQVHMEAKLGDKTINASANSYQLSGRVLFRPEYPRPKAGEVYGKEWPHPVITASLDKTPAQLAADIKRRLLPDYERGLELARKANAEAESYMAGMRGNLARLLDRAPTEEEAKEGRSNLRGMSLAGDAYGSVQAFEKSANIELRGLPVAVAVKIMALARQEVSE